MVHSFSEPLSENNYQFLPPPPLAVTVLGGSPDYTHQILYMSSFQPLHSSLFSRCPVPHTHSVTYVWSPWQFSEQTAVAPTWWTVQMENAETQKLLHLLVSVWLFELLIEHERVWVWTAEGEGQLGGVGVWLKESKYWWEGAESNIEEGMDVNSRLLFCFKEHGRVWGPHCSFQLNAAE